MSIRAVEWALHEVTGLTPAQKLVLVVLAEHAGSDGKHAFPSAKTLSEAVGVSVRQVRTVLKQLQDLGLISHGDPSHVAHIVPNRRPTVYDLSLTGKDRVRSMQGRVTTLDIDGKRRPGVKSSAPPGVKSSALRGEVWGEAHFLQTINQEKNHSGAAPHECAGGWRGSEDMPTPCPICKPHLSRPARQEAS